MNPKLLDRLETYMDEICWNEDGLQILLIKQHIQRKQREEANRLAEQKEMDSFIELLLDGRAVIA